MLETLVYLFSLSRNILSMKNAKINRTRAETKPVGKYLRFTHNSQLNKRQKLCNPYTKVLHFAIGKPVAYHGKFAIKRTAKSTLANYGKLSRAKHHGKKRSPASHKRMANNGIFTFPSVKASHGLPRYFSLQINKKNGKSAAFCQKMLVFWTLEKPQ